MFPEQHRERMRQRHLQQAQEIMEVVFNSALSLQNEIAEFQYQIADEVTLNRARCIAEANMQKVKSCFGILPLLPRSVTVDDLSMTVDYTGPLGGGRGLKVECSFGYNLLVATQQRIIELLNPEWDKWVSLSEFHPETVVEIRIFVDKLLYPEIYGSIVSYEHAVNAASQMVTDWVKQSSKEDIERNRKNAPWTINFTDRKHNVSSLVAVNISDLDGSISGIVMDGGRVNFVVDKDGEKVTPQQIGSAQSEEW